MGKTRKIITSISLTRSTKKLIDEIGGINVSEICERAIIEELSSNPAIMKKRLRKQLKRHRKNIGKHNTEISRIEQELQEIDGPNTSLDETVPTTLDTILNDMYDIYIRCDYRMPSKIIDQRSEELGMERQELINIFEENYHCKMEISVVI